MKLIRFLGNLSHNPDNAIFDCGKGNFCCSEAAFKGTSACCESSEKVFFLGPSENTTTIGGAVGPGYISTTSTSSTTSATTTSASSTTANTAGSQNTNGADITKSAANTGGGGLSPGAAAGIAIAAFVGIAIVAAAIFFIYRQAKNTQQLKEQLDAMQGRANDGQQWAPAPTQMEAFAPKAPDMPQTYELGSADKLIELPGAGNRGTYR